MSMLTVTVKEFIHYQSALHAGNFCTEYATLRIYLWFLPRGSPFQGRAIMKTVLFYVRKGKRGVLHGHCINKRKTMKMKWNCQWRRQWRRQSIDGQRVSLTCAENLSKRFNFIFLDRENPASGIKKLTDEDKMLLTFLIFSSKKENIRKQR